MTSNDEADFDYFQSAHTHQPINHHGEVGWECFPGHWHPQVQVPSPGHLLRPWCRRMHASRPLNLILPFQGRALVVPVNLGDESVQMLRANDHPWMFFLPDW